MRKYRNKRLALLFSLLVLVATMAVSFTHLAYGIQLTTGITLWESWAMAFVIDAGMVAAEYAALVDRPTGYTRTSVIIGLLLSAAFNCIAFTAKASWPYLAMVLGFAVPAAMFVTTHIAHVLSAGSWPIRARASSRKVSKPKLRRVI